MNTQGVAALGPVTVFPPEAAPKKSEAAIGEPRKHEQPSEKEQLSKALREMENRMKEANVSLEFSAYGAKGERIAVVVADKETGEVIREIPAKEIQNLYNRMSELAGVIFNRQA
ncbi:MAG: flagellar protein FlaG [Pseudomonadota bacterium]|nr:flagellar protein FlaG [Pseudomonadota bacterium]